MDIINITNESHPVEWEQKPMCISVRTYMHTHIILVCIYLNRILCGLGVHFQSLRALLHPMLMPSVWPVDLHQSPKSCPFCIRAILVVKLPYFYIII